MAVYRLSANVTALQFLVAVPPWPANVISYYVEPSPAGGLGGTFYQVSCSGVLTPIVDTEWVVTDADHNVSVVTNATFVLAYTYVSP